jgi:hypothetical protein
VIHSMRGWGARTRTTPKGMWSHLWSHSRMSGAVQQVLPGTRSSVTEPHWTPTVEWSQNSKV